MREGSKGRHEGRDAGVEHEEHHTAAAAGRARRFRRGPAAVSLIELLVIVVVVGIIMALALPSQSRMMERGYYDAARDTLMTIYNGQRGYYLRNDAYLGDPSTMAEWRLLQMDDPNIGDANEQTKLPVEFKTKATGCAPPPCFLATAKRIGGPCGVVGDEKMMKVNQKRVFSDNWDWRDLCGG